MEISPENSINTNNSSPIPPKVKISKRLWVGFILIDLIIAASVYLYFTNNSTEKSLNPITQLRSKMANTETISPTPFPFQELTVPYLRAKAYKSTLGELSVQSENSSYVSYLTSYDSEGFKINGLLTKPTGDPTNASGQGMPVGGWPAIVFVHGYIPPAQYSTTGSAYSSYIDYLASAGFVVFKIDLRGHGNSEGEAGGGYFGSDYIIDTLNAYAALENTDFINPEKIGLWGHSMAGNILLRAHVAKPEIPAINIWAGAVYTYLDREKYGIQDASFQMSSLSASRQSRRRQLIEKYGEPSSNSPFWKQVIPTNYLSDIKGAIQINHAIDDSVVNIGYSRDLNSLLNDTNVSHELHEYESGGHDIEGESFNQAMENTVNFYNKYLK